MNKFLITAIAIVSLVPGIASLTVNTPGSVTQCQPTKITWTDGAPPYYLSVLPGGQTTAAPLVSLGTSNAMSQTWLVNVTPNQYITIALKDSTGETAFTDQILVQANNDVSCMNASASATPTESDASPEASNASGSGKPVTTSASGVARATSSAKASKTGSSGATAAANDAASLSVGTFGLASLLGLVGIVLF